MPQVDHIFVPIDLQDNAGPVVAWAALLARTFRSRLTLLHVNESFESMKRHPLAQTEPLLGRTEDLEAWRATYTQQARLTLTQLIAQHCDGLSVATALVEGRAHVAILEHLAKSPAGLVVMGTHGRPWYQRVLIGSTAEALLRAAPCPVLIVPNTADRNGVPRLKSLLLPTDFSVDGMVSEAWALQLAENKDMLLLHAVENPLLDTYDPDKVEIDFQRAMEESRAHPPRSAQPFWDHAHRVSHAKLSVLRQQFLGVYAQVEVLVQEGPAAQAILATAEKRTVDLIVMSTHGRGGVRRLLLGSVAEKVIRLALCPVLAVRSE
ncbi:MAG: universal stress protein [Deltaproteobacteria bacterium]|nr:universal stress protein [Deltaproteobacteria bacterium]